MALVQTVFVCLSVLLISPIASQSDDDENNSKQVTNHERQNEIAHTSVSPLTELTKNTENENSNTAADISGNEENKNKNTIRKSNKNSESDVVNKTDDIKKSKDNDNIQNKAKIVEETNTESKTVFAMDKTKNINRALEDEPHYNESVKAGDNVIVKGAIPDKYGIENDEDYVSVSMEFDRASKIGDEIKKSELEAEIQQSKDEIDRMINLARSYIKEIKSDDLFSIGSASALIIFSHLTHYEIYAKKYDHSVDIISSSKYFVYYSETKRIHRLMAFLLRVIRIHLTGLKGKKKLRKTLTTQVKTKVSIPDFLRTLSDRKGPILDLYNFKPPTIDIIEKILKKDCILDQCYVEDELNWSMFDEFI